MSNVSKYIEAKKQYYTELFELAQLTMPEKVIMDITLSLYEEIESWLNERKHTKEKARYLYSLIVRYGKIPLDYYGLSSHHNSESKDKLIVNNSYEDIEFEGDNDFEHLIDELIRLYSKMFGIAVSDIPHFFFSLAASWGCIRPFLRLHEFVSFNKKEIADELSKKGITPGVIEELKAIFNSGEEPYIVQDCLADLSVDMGENRETLKPLSDLYDTIYDGISLIKEDVELYDDGFHDEINNRFNVLINRGLEGIDELMLDIVVFKKGYDPLCCKLSEKEKEAFELILSQPYIAPKIEELMNRVTVTSNVPAEDEEAFTLPDNYFNGLHTSSYKYEYLGGSLFSYSTDVAKFIEMINYIADRGFIENNSKKKQLLAYRLTGRMRPEGALPTIQWIGGASNSADCLFLMKCSDSKNKYAKMRQFFDADFPPKKKTSSLVHSAGTRFMKKLNELFPHIYNLPKRLT